MGRIDFSDCELGPYILTRILGAGTDGNVYHAVDTTTDRPTPFAVKCLEKGDISHQRGVQLVSEILYHEATAECPNVLTLRDIFDQGLNLFLVFDLCDTDMFQAITHGVYWRNDARIREVFIEILDAVTACHERGIYHRDLKPGNIMCNADGTGIQVGDFGCATHHRVSRDGGCGTPNYMSPECWMSNVGDPYYSVPTDIWSLGVILFNMVANRDPWDAAIASDKEFKAFIDDEDHLFHTSPISDQLNVLLKWIMHPIPAKRLPIPAIRKVVLEMDTFYKCRRPRPGPSPLSRQATFAGPELAYVEPGNRLNGRRKRSVVTSRVRKH